MPFLEVAKTLKEVTIFVDKKVQVLRVNVEDSKVIISDGINWIEVTVAGYYKQYLGKIIKDLDIIKIIGCSGSISGGDLTLVSSIIGLHFCF